jgi:hypothetical protein
MKKTVKVGGRGPAVTITDKQYLAAGGEAEIYVVNGMAYKLYHDPKTKILPAQKMQELGAIKNSQVVIPQDTVFDTSTGDAIGYVTKFVDDVTPLLKLFNKAFKVDNHIDNQMVAELVKQMQLVVTDVHTAHCLVVDLNELNILVNVDKKLTPWFIDTDSYCTPHFKATAIMDSVRDRKVSTTDKNGTLHYHPTEMSDWFSWGILTFWLYTNVHPFRGNHKDYKPSEKRQQMDDGISVFHPGVRVPPTVNDFNVIPPRHLDWYKQIFLKGDRGIPPLPDGMVPVLVPTAFVTVKSTDRISVDQVGAFPEAVLQVIDIMGVKYVLTTTRVFMGNREVNTYGKCKKAALCSTPDGTAILAVLNDNKVTFSDAIKGTVYGTINSSDMFVRNRAIYTMSQGRMVENTFKTVGMKVFHMCNGIENVSSLSAKMFDGCILQDLLGKKYLTLPYEVGKAWSKYMAFLDGYRVVDAKADQNVVVIVAEKKGKYDRFVIVFSKAYTEMDVKKDEDIAYNGINFATMPNGLSILMTSDDEIRLFRDAKASETLSNPPFDSAMKLFITSDGFHFINGTSIHQIKRK